MLYDYNTDLHGIGNRSLLYYFVTSIVILRPFLGYRGFSGLLLSSPWWWWWCMWKSDEMASKRSENRHFRWPHSHLTSLLWRTHANICINLILLETAYWDPLDSMDLSSFTFLWWAPKTCNSAHILSVQGQFRVNQGRWFWYLLCYRAGKIVSLTIRFPTLSNEQ